MLFESENKDLFQICASRRNDLINTIKEKFPEKNGLVLLIAGFENDRSAFWQESSFYYYTGITEPGTLITIDMQGKTTLYVPNCMDTRSQWLYSPVLLTPANAKQLKVDAVEVLGDRCPGFQLFPFFKKDYYNVIINLLQQSVKDKKTIFTLFPENEHEYVEQRLVVNRLDSFVEGLAKHITDISSIVATMRRRKDMHEIDMLTKAIEITNLAHEAAAQAIEPGVFEREVQASLEYMMIGSGARTAFPSIVATGKNGTILHYNQNEHELNSGELVVVDIGAAYQGYCADLTRTYPVNGKFNKRQKELYDIVLATQEHIADLAKPGMYLNNPEQLEKSLHHLAKEFLKKYDLDKYFIHGIGHYLGLDVHDVGNSREQLAESDVITIEPGIYIPEEKIGIRIEDNYWIVKNGAICLSEHLPKKSTDIEELVRQKFDSDLN